MDFTTTNWIAIGSTLILGTLAIFGPYLSERVKRKYLAPRMQILFSEVTPHCILTFWTSPQDPALHEPVYYFRAQVTNTGESQAHFCEVVMENLWIYDTAGKAIKSPNFAPRNLSFETNQDPVQIHTNRRIYCAIGHILSPAFQARKDVQTSFYDIPGASAPNALRFSLEPLVVTNGQPNCLVPGKYAIEIKVYSENAPPVTAYFQITWTGKWQDRPEEMFRECVIERKPAI